MRKLRSTRQIINEALPKGIVTPDMKSDDEVHIPIKFIMGLMEMHAAQAMAFLSADGRNVEPVSEEVQSVMLESLHTITEYFTDIEANDFDDEDDMYEDDYDPFDFDPEAVGFENDPDDDDDRPDIVITIRPIDGGSLMPGIHPN